MDYEAAHNNQASVMERHLECPRSVWVSVPCIVRFQVTERAEDRTEETEAHYLLSSRHDCGSSRGCALRTGLR